MSAEFYVRDAVRIDGVEYILTSDFSGTNELEQWAYAVKLYNGKGMIYKIFLPFVEVKVEGEVELHADYANASVSEFGHESLMD